MNEEKWLPVKGYEGLYEVSSHGRVKSLERTVIKHSKFGEQFAYIVKEKILKQSINRVGYFAVSLHNNKMKTIVVHKLVCEAFIGECQKGYEICHRDSNKLNNCLENLRYDTSLNNKQDMKLNETWPSREKSHYHKLTESEVQEIYSLLKNTSIHRKEIGEMYSVHKDTISAINTGRSWHLDSIKYPIR